jgi:membrane protease YdiL (CAAX protease family)
MLILFLAAVLIKILDTFILRLDEALGEAILTKSVGFVLVVGYVWICGKKLRDIGFHTQAIGNALLVGSACFAALFALAYSVQLIALLASGEEAGLAFSAVDPKSGMEGGLLFGLWLLLGNLVNSAMEEGLFRGTMLPHFRIRYSFWRANLLQAALFAIWHLNWPIKLLLDGDATLGEAGFEALALLLATGIGGLVYGYLYHKTDNLWAPYVAHTINNAILNVVFIRTAEGLQSGVDFGLFLAIWLPGHLAMIPLIRWWTQRLRMSEAKPWSSAG